MYTQTKLFEGGDAFKHILDQFYHDYFLCLRVIKILFILDSTTCLFCLYLVVMLFF